MKNGHKIVTKNISESSSSQSLSRASVVINIGDSLDSILNLVVHDGVHKHCHRVLGQNLKQRRNLIIHAQASARSATIIYLHLPLEEEQRSFELSYQWLRRYQHMGWWRRLQDLWLLRSRFCQDERWQFSHTPVQQKVFTLNTSNTAGDLDNFDDKTEREGESDNNKNNWTNYQQLSTNTRSLITRICNDILGCMNYIFPDLSLFSFSWSDIDTRPYLEYCWLEWLALWWSVILECLKLNHLIRLLRRVRKMMLYFMLALINIQTSECVSKCI